MNKHRDIDFSVWSSLVMHIDFLILFVVDPFFFGSFCLILYNLITDRPVGIVFKVHNGCLAVWHAAMAANQVTNKSSRQRSGNSPNPDNQPVYWQSPDTPNPDNQPVYWHSRNTPTPDNQPVYWHSRNTSKTDNQPVYWNSRNTPNTINQPVYGSKGNTPFIQSNVKRNSLSLSLSRRAYLCL